MLRKFGKAFLKCAAWLLSLAYRLVPSFLRQSLVSGLMLLESRIGPPEKALARLFSLADSAERLIAERATVYGGGVNPKHRLMNYHDFFVSNIGPGSRVLDIGCGIGEVARSIAKRVEGARVTGIDSDPSILTQARNLTDSDNPQFVTGDATKELPGGPWDVVVLSNVLEHIERRTEFLKALVSVARPNLLLIRVPVFERHWHMPLRRELGVDFHSDPTHFIEYTTEEFAAEMAGSDLRLLSSKINWGEIWAVVEPVR